MNPLEIIEKNDAVLYESIKQSRNNAFTDGALSLKSKLLIALALDACKGAANGVKSLAMQAIDAGATKEEIMETLRVCQYICGVGSIYTAAIGLQDVLK